MDRVAIDLESIKFISDWYERTDVKINQIPIVFQNYQLDFYESGQHMVCDFAFKDDQTFMGKCTLFKAGSTQYSMKVSYSAYCDYSSLALKRISELMGVAKEDIQFDESQILNFQVGFDFNFDEQDPEYAFKKHIATVTAYFNIYLMYFMANYQPELEEYVTTKRETVTKRKKSNKKSHNSVSVTYINIIKYIRDVKNGKKKLPRHNKRCQYAFGVKGHYRHYKNGKVVWIAPHTRNTLEQRKKRDKTYKLNLKVGEKKC